MPPTRLSTRLRRISNSATIIDEIDGLRFLAIVPVVLLHATWATLAHRLGHDPDPEWGSTSGSFLVQLLSAGWQGVQFSFMLSAFVVALPFARHFLKAEPSVSIPAFYGRRLWRIAPPYILCLTIAFLVAGDYTTNFPHYLAGLFYTHQLVYQTTNPLLDTTWSLEVQMWFYLIAPVACLIFAVENRWVRRTTLVAVATSYSYWVTYHVRDLPRFSNTLPVMLPFFAVGLLLADLYVSGQIEGKRSIAWDVLALACAVFAVYSAAWNGWDFYWLTPVAMMGVMVAAFRGAVLNRVVRSPLIVILGGMSYSIYLWHTPILEAVWRVMMPRLPQTLGLNASVLQVGGASLAIALIAGVPLYLAFERPFMRRNEAKRRGAAQSKGMPMLHKLRQVAERPDAEER